ncbi:MAG: ankyrin repeat domain-containing protein [Spirochaetia bacterium]|nr:ankyrin repeat domain-containing protein [Spirochaetia bacterium]
MKNRYPTILLLIIYLANCLSAQGAPLTRETFVGAIRKSDLNSVNLHLAAGFRGDLPANETDKTTALMVSLRSSEAVTRAIIEAGLKDPDARELWLDLRETALMKALLLGTENTALLLLDAGANPKLKNRFGWNALHFAAWSGKTNLVKKLLGDGLSPSEPTVDGWTPLHLAARFARVETCRLLIASGADPMRETPLNQTPVSLALRGGFAECLKTLAQGKIFFNSEIHSNPSIQNNPEEDFLTLRLAVTAGKDLPLEIRIVPAFGNVIRSFRFGTNDLLKPVPSGRLTEISGGLPILFPAPNSISGGKLKIGKREVEMHSPDAPRPFILHGTAWQNIWQPEPPIASAGRVRQTSVCKMDVQNPAWPAFPFSNSLRLTITLTRDALRLDFQISNQDQVALPLGLGAHPYWKVFPDTKVRLDTPRLQTISYSPSGRSLTTIPDPLLTPDGFHPGENWNPTTHFYLRSPGENSQLYQPHLGIKITMSASPELSHLVLYRPTQSEICLEHQSSAPDAHQFFAAGNETDASLLLLSPGQTKKLFIEYRLENI